MNVYTDHQGLQYFNTKQKVNLQQASSYLSMCEDISHIYYKHGVKIGKPDYLSRHSGKEKSRMEAHIADEGQLLNLKNDDVGEEEVAEDVELQGIDVTM